LNFLFCHQIVTFFETAKYDHCKIPPLAGSNFILMKIKTTFCKRGLLLGIFFEWHGIKISNLMPGFIVYQRRKY